MNFVIWLASFGTLRVINAQVLRPTGPRNREDIDVSLDKAGVDAQHWKAFLYDHNFA